MKPFSQQKTLDAFLLVAIVLYIFGGILTYIQIQRLISSNRWVDHSYQVITAANKAERYLFETRARIDEYVLTNNQLLIKNTPQSMSAAQFNIHLIRILTSDNPDQQVRLDKLEPLVKQRLFLLHEMITDKQTNNSHSKTPTAISQEGQNLISRVAELFFQIKQEELDLLNQRNMTANMNVKFSNLLLLIVGILGGTLLLVCVGLLNFHLKQRNKAEEKLIISMENLKRSNLELERFCYIASHDLQEPLRMVASHTQLLERRYKDKLDDDAKEFISFAVDGANRMQTLLNDLLTYSRINTQAKPLEISNLEEILSKVLSNLSVPIEETGAIITHDPLPTLSVDQVQIMQLLQNLISNAIKFVKPGDTPQIKITAKPQGNEWLFSIADNGIGIQAEYFDKIFVIFQRLHTRSEYPGTGIGLAVCQKIVENHGGHIWVDSTLDQGTIFYFTLPSIKE